MNRLVKFRGKDLIHNEWIYGGLAEDKNENAVILPKNNWRKGGCVDKDTVGQFTGLYDKNGREIYEGDIIYQRTYFGNRPCVVRFEEGTFMVGYHEGSSTKHTPILVKNSGVVIGNIHDNPELIKEK